MESNSRDIILFENSRVNQDFSTLGDESSANKTHKLSQRDASAGSDSQLQNTFFPESISMVRRRFNNSDNA